MRLLLTLFARRDSLASNFHGSGYQAAREMFVSVRSVASNLSNERVPLLARRNVPRPSCQHLVIYSLRSIRNREC